MNRSNKNKKGFALILPLIVVAILIVGALWFYKSRPVGENGILVPTFPTETPVHYCENGCPDGYFCGRSYACPRGLDPADCDKSGSDICVKSCTNNSDCNEDESCEEFNIFRGDVGFTELGCLNTNKTKDNQLVCEGVGGTWLAKYNECVGLTAENCNGIGGNSYDDCASACRHDPDAEMCTANCVEVCSFIDDEYTDLVAKAEKKGTINVIVTLNIDYIIEPELEPDEIQKQRELIKNTQEKIIDSLSGTNAQVYSRYESVPNLALTVDDVALKILIDSPYVSVIQEDLPEPYNN